MSSNQRPQSIFESHPRVKIDLKGVSIQALSGNRLRVFTLPMKVPNSTFTQVQERREHAEKWVQALLTQQPSLFIGAELVDGNPAGVFICPEPIFIFDVSGDKSGPYFHHSLAVLRKALVSTQREVRPMGYRG